MKVIGLEKYNDALKVLINYLERKVHKVPIIYNQNV